MTYARKRRYGVLHVAARTGQIDALLDRLAGYREELDARRESLARWSAQAVWADPGFIAAAERNLGGVAAALAGLEQRASTARAGFQALPLLDEAGLRPAAIEHEPLAD